MDNKKSKYVIYFGGGTMTGVFGVGVARAFEKADFYTNINAVYGASSGVMTCAYFLSKKTELGVTVYLNDLQEGFISFRGCFIGAWQRFQNRFLKDIPMDSFSDALQVEHLMKIIKNDKSFDMEEVISQNIPIINPPLKYPI